MAHEIDFTRSTTGNMFSVLETAWHRHGHVLAEAPSYAGALTLA